MPLNAISRCEFLDDPKEWGIRFKQTRKRSGVRRRGLNFERKAQDALERCYPQYYARGPWIRTWLYNETNFRLYQPDGLYLDFNRQHCVIVEIKLRHTSEAWWQVTKQYLPLCQFIFPGWQFSVVEICSWYDISEPFPIDTKLCEKIGAVPPGEFRVFISRANGHDVK